MPFTPFHLGPGLLLKAVAPRHLSLTAFALAQVAMDLEPLYFISRGEWPVHRGLHTVGGGAAVGVAVGLVLPVLARPWAPWQATASPPGPAARAEGRRSAAMAGGVIGGASHALLDGLMHRDVHALRPLAETQWVVGPEGVAALHLGCVLAGVLGALGLVARRARARRAAVD